MKSTQLSGETHLLVLDPGEEVTEHLTEYLRTHKIAAGMFQAIGALQAVTFAFWNPDSKEYEHIGLHEQVEVLSLVGNVARGGGDEPKIHAHVTVGQRDGRALGGHLITGTVFPTLEVMLTVFDFRLVRRQDPGTGLYLLALDR